MELGFHSSFTYLFLYIVPKSNIVILCFLKQLNFLLLLSWKRERKTFSKSPTYYANESELPDQLLPLPRHGRSPQTVLWCPGQPQRRLIMALWFLLLPVFAYSTHDWYQKERAIQAPKLKIAEIHTSCYTHFCHLSTSCWNLRNNFWRFFSDVDFRAVRTFLCTSKSANNEHKLCAVLQRENGRHR